VGFSSVLFTSAIHIRGCLVDGWAVARGGGGSESSEGIVVRDLARYC
jgi:hypothetical protein